MGAIFLIAKVESGRWTVTKNTNSPVTQAEAVGLNRASGESRRVARAFTRFADMRRSIEFHV
jgi:hypothetical protein